MRPIPQAWRKFAVLLLISCPVLQAHAISMSHGDATVRGDHLDFILNIPLYEAAHTPQPDRTLLDHLRFSSRGEAGRLIQKSCHEDAAQATLICAAEYVFSRPIDRLDIDCTLYQVTVPNHVHLLRAENA